MTPSMFAINAVLFRVTSPMSAPVAVRSTGGPVFLNDGVDRRSGGIASTGRHCAAETPTEQFDDLLDSLEQKCLGACHS
jgi:hypothetical protein